MAISAHHEEDVAGAPGRARMRSVVFLIVLLAVLLLAFVPPLVNVSRFQRRVDSNISAALGRPVHFDHLSLNLLPMPGFTLENFVIEEDPAFGYEPTLHADEVRINLRLSSLWRRRVEFSSISFTDPSVNLVHLADGRWNLQGLLTQASRIPAAPTGQKYPGPTPRFPYIEASGARVNLKLDQEKLPVSLTDATFSLSQPVEHQWRFRIEANPQRTDITPGASGAVEVEGTLGGSDAAHGLANMPINLHATWQEAQLGGLTSLLLGRDAGLRGDLAANLTVLGTIARNTISTTVSLNNARRADFIPQHALSLSISCHAAAESNFHAFSSIQCRLPQADSSLSAMLALVASIPDVRRPKLSSIRIDVPSLPAQTLYDWLGVATPHPPTSFAGRGTITGALIWGNTGQAATTGPASQPEWTGELKLSGEWLKLPALGDDGAPLSDIVLSSMLPAPLTARTGRSLKPLPQPAPDSFNLAPVSLPLGGEHAVILTGHVDDSGYSLHLAGLAVPDQLLALGDAIPQFGDGLKQVLAPEDTNASSDSTDKGAPGSAAGAVHTVRGHEVVDPPKPAPQVPVALDLSAARSWGGAQTWTRTTQTQLPPRSKSHTRP